MGLTGVLNVAIIPNVVVIPVNLNGAGIGQGGAFTATSLVLEAAGWTAGTGLVNTVSPGNPGGTTIATSGSGTLGFWTTTFGGVALGDPITLVTPTFLSAFGNALPVVTTLSIVGLVPEPGSLLLVGAGIVGLALAGEL